MNEAQKKDNKEALGLIYGVSLVGLIALGLSVAAPYLLSTVVTNPLVISGVAKFFTYAGAALLGGGTLVGAAALTAKVLPELAQGQLKKTQTKRKTRKVQKANKKPLKMSPTISTRNSLGEITLQEKFPKKTQAKKTQAKRTMQPKKRQTVFGQDL